MTEQKRKDAFASFLFCFYRFDLRQRALFQPLAPGKADEEQQAPDAQFAAHGTPNAHQAQPGSQQERQRQPDAPHTEYVQHKQEVLSPAPCMAPLATMEAPNMGSAQASMRKT